MIVDNVKEYYNKSIWHLNVDVPSDKKLRKTEADVLTSLLVYRYYNGDLKDYVAVCKYLIDSGAVDNKKCVSHYRGVLTKKNWIKATRYNIIIGSKLLSTGKKTFTIEFQNRNNETMGA